MSEDFNNQNENTSKIDINSVNIDDIQKTLMQQLQDDDGEDDLDNYESNPDAAQLEGADTDYLANEFYDITPVDKKYVLAISADNVPYFEELEPEERAKLVNKLLTNYQDMDKHPPEKERLQSFTKHSLVVLVTIAVGFPLIFNMVNASIEATLNSYRQVQYNFEKLYQQKGGVKRKDLTKMQNLQY